jgi:hypothetical protein
MGREGQERVRVVAVYGKYEVRVDGEGRLSCTCPAWTRKVHGEPSCHHIRRYLKEKLKGGIPNLRLYAETGAAFEPAENPRVKTLI